MPDRRQHRGRDPADAALFTPAALPVLRTAVDELCWLFDRGYSARAALALVGDRHGLRARQRLAVLRSSCSQAERTSRGERRIPLTDLSGRALAIDGLNCLITIEAALGGGLLLRGRDEVMRDLASVHGSYRAVEETAPALQAMSDLLQSAAPAAVKVFLDRPVSNSGKLRALMETISEARGQRWEVLLVDSPDRELRTGAREHGWVIASGDGPLLDSCGPWTPLPEEVIAGLAPGAWVLDLR